ncbi:MAG: glycosyltransferase family 9 protein [Candidatus Omnitrophica bacterium]|nr:glycosyltransferase family 9 protein [Candidatus Omnitrophota bacterium]
MERVLVSNVNWLGDSLLMTPVLRGLKEKAGVMYLVLFTHRRTREIFFRNPFIDEIIEFTDKDLKNLPGFLSKAVRLARLELDTAIMLKASLSRLFMFKLARIKRIVSFGNKRYINFLLDVKVKADPFVLHRLNYYLKLLEALGIYVDSYQPDFFLDKNDIDKAGDFIQTIAGDKKVVILHPAANWKLKCWPAVYFASLNDLLQEKLGVSVIISGRKDDVLLAEKISALCRYKPVSVCGRFNLRELAAIIKKSSLFISADTGIMHLAAAVNTPLVALFGPTSPLITSPRTSSFVRIIQKDVGCKIPCYNLKCSNNLCMKEIKPSEVFQAAAEIIK